MIGSVKNMNRTVFYKMNIKATRNKSVLKIMGAFPTISRCALYILVTLATLHLTLAEITNCTFADTVNITDSQLLVNGSYNFEGLSVPPHLTGYYEYIELFGGTHEFVAKHLRGCVCQLKRCVKFCCHPRANMYRLTKNSRAQFDEQLNEELTYSPYLNITLHNSSRPQMHVVDEFVVQQGIPCDPGYMLMPHEWELFENGSVLRVTDQLLISRRDYCLDAYRIRDRFVLNPMNCDDRLKKSPNIMLNTIIMLISLPFLYATILIFWLIPELRNLHTKCLISYLLSLAIGNTLIITINLRKSDYVKAVCAAMGFIAYYFLSAVFFWLNVICFDMWQIFHGTKANLTQCKWINYYSLYGWGMPSVMTAITVILQYSDIPDELKSGIGVTHCWLKSNDWSAMLYFYGPCFLLIAINIVIFYVTVKRIYYIRKELDMLTQERDGLSRLRSQQNNVWLFFRMFIIMGINWLLEIIAYMIDNKSKYAVIFQITNIYNGFQGLIIFMYLFIYLLVMKKKVLHAVMATVWTAQN
ncbi:G-protein coupled receptor Mth2 isoform X2 [Zeugodacus cucurbitae]|uniref:G-protein coupled receptor Mth2 isoform X2 n=1 Tax=Zeugodacus cucurbitae TaxID=28588 RepID=UPI0023D8F8EC|nr:G-protein coupled receptor Mth2 isoform X2 [Zeugodacus cucurbitae]